MISAKEAQELTRPKVEKSQQAELEEILGRIDIRIKKYAKEGSTRCDFYFPESWYFGRNKALADEVYRTLEEKDFKIRKKIACAGTNGEFVLGVHIDWNLQ